MLSDAAVEAAAAILREFSVDENVGEYDATAVWGAPDAVVRAALTAAAPFIAARALEEAVDRAMVGQVEIIGPHTTRVGEMINHDGAIYIRCAE